MLLFFYYHCTLHAKTEKRLSILFKGGLITRETKQSIHLCNIYLIKLFETETRLKWGQSARWVTILLSCGTIARLQLAVKNKVLHKGYIVRYMSDHGMSLPRFLCVSPLWSSRFNYSTTAVSTYHSSSMTVHDSVQMY